MSMFTCARCRAICNSDDGCEDIGNMRRLSFLVCLECAAEIHEQREAEEDAASKAEGASEGPPSAESASTSNIESTKERA